MDDSPTLDLGVRLNIPRARRDRTVRKMTGFGLDVQDSILGRDVDANPVFYPVGTDNFFLRGKAN